MVQIWVEVDESERAAFRHRAAAAGLTLSEWLRGAAQQRLEREQPSAIRSVDDLDRFFAACRDRESGTEPDWDRHLETMAASRRRE